MRHPSCCQVPAVVGFVAGNLAVLAVCYHLLFLFPRQQGISILRLLTRSSMARCMLRVLVELLLLRALVELLLRVLVELLLRVLVELLLRVLVELLLRVLLRVLVGS